MTRREAVSRQLDEISQTAERAFTYRGRGYSPRVVDDAIADVWRAFSGDGGLDRAERLIEVVAFLVERESARFKANPRKYAERQRELAAA
jgi:hypothetical protein